MHKRHLAVWVNMQYGTATFNWVKQITITFPVAFKTIPSVMFSPNDNSAFPAFKQNVTKAWFVIRLQSNRTWSIDWSAFEK
jgi:hypothetical protein